MLKNDTVLVVSNKTHDIETTGTQQVKLQQAGEFITKARIKKNSMLKNLIASQFKKPMGLVGIFLYGA